MNRIAVRLLATGFLHPASRLEHELVDQSSQLRLPVHDLDADLQFFHCRVETNLVPGAIEYIVADAAPAASGDLVERFLSTRFPGSTTVFLRSQAIGRAVVDSPAGSPLAQGAAAAVAVVMYSVAWDDSETIAVEGGGTKHVLAVRQDDAGLWAEPVAPQE